MITMARALAAFNLSAAQELSLRNYIGQGKVVINELPVNHVELLILRNPETGAYVGQAELKPSPDGGIFVAKVTGAAFDTKA